MKYVKYIFIVCAILSIWSCDNKDLEEVRALPADMVVTPSVQSMEEVAIDQDSYDAKEEVTLQWSAADFGYSAAVNYSIYMSTDAVADFVLASNIGSTTYTIDHQALYDKLVGESNLALPTNAVSTVHVYITATIGSDFTVVKSDVVDFTFDIARIGLEGDALYISGDYNGWSTSGSAIVGLDKVYAGYVDMNWKGQESIGYKFVDFLYSSASWGDWYGGSLDALSTSGDNMATTPGMKFFNVDLNTNTARIMNFTKVGLTGINGAWATPALEMAYDYVNKYYYVVSAASTQSFRILCFSPDDTGWGWSYTMGPRTIEDLHLSLGSDVKVFDNNISKPLVGGDANMSLDVEGTYKFILYYTGTDAMWHFKVERP